MQYPTLYVQDAFIRASGLNGSTNTVPAAWEIRGNFGSQHIMRALQRVTQGHEGLRTAITYDKRKDQFGQRVVDRGAIDRFVRVFESPSGDAEAQLSALMGRLLSHEFDLSKPPLWRGFLVRTGRDRWVLGIAFAHVIMDGYSVDVLSRHLARALASDVQPEVPQLGTFARAERSRRPSSEQVTFWREQYARRTPLRSTWKGTAHYHVVPVPPFAPALVAELDGLAKRVGASISTLFAAATALATSAVLDCRVPVLGFTTAQRTKQNAEVFGPLHDHLPVLGGGAPAELPFARFVNGLHQRRAKSREHRLPCGILEEIAETTPYDVALNFSPFAAPTPYDAGKGATVMARPIPTIGRVGVHRATSVAPVLAAILRPGADGSVTGDVTAISALHSEAEVRRLAAAVSVIAQRGLQRPDAPIGALAQRRS